MLRIYRHVPLSYNEYDIQAIDFTTIGLKKSSPSYDKGRKTKAYYLSPVDEALTVEKIFSDVVDVNGKLIGLQVQFNWYNEDSTVGLTKTEIVKELNRYEAETIKRKRRERIIDYLVAGAEGTPIEPYVNAIFDHYYEQVDKYKQKGTEEFLTAINGETDQTILAYLAIELPVSGGGTVTVKQSILGQIT